MIYPKNSRYHSTYHEPLFFEPSKDIADARTQSYFNWYKGDRNITKDKNFYPSRWPRITNNERNYSHDVFKFGNCAPLKGSTSNKSNHSPGIYTLKKFFLKYNNKYNCIKHKIKEMLNNKK